MDLEVFVVFYRPELPTGRRPSRRKKVGKGGEPGDLDSFQNHGTTVSVLHLLAVITLKIRSWIN